MYPVFYLFSYFNLFVYHQIIIKLCLMFTLRASVMNIHRLAVDNHEISQ
jgi:hypothetical protein